MTAASTGQIPCGICPLRSERDIESRRYARAKRTERVEDERARRPRGVSRYSTRGGRASTTSRSSRPASSRSTSRCASVPGGISPTDCRSSLNRDAPWTTPRGSRRSSVPRGGPPRGGPPRGRARSAYTETTGDAFGSSARSSTSASAITGWNVISSRTCSGTSSRSARFRSGRITWSDPRRARRAPSASARRSAAPGPAASPRRSSRPCVCTGRPVSSEASAVAIVMPALGPSFGIAPAGTWTWNVLLSNAVGIDPELLRPRPDGRQRDLRRLLHHVAELPRQDELLAALRQRVASTKRTSPPAALTARPVATPGTAVRSAASRKNFCRPSASRTSATSTVDGRRRRSPTRSGRRLAEDRPELALELADARLARVLGDDRCRAPRR